MKTEARLLGFSYDFGVTVIRHQNADAMVLASALMRGCIHSPDNIENGRCPGGEMPIILAHWLGPWRQHFYDESWRGSGYTLLADSTFCVFIL